MRDRENASGGESVLCRTTRMPQTDALPAELRSPRTKYTQFRPHSVFSKVGVGQPLLAVRLRCAEIDRGQPRVAVLQNKLTLRPRLTTALSSSRRLMIQKRCAATRPLSPLVSLRRGRDLTKDFSTTLNDRQFP